MHCLAMLPRGFCRNAVQTSVARGGSALHGTVKTPLSLLLPSVYSASKFLTVSYVSTL
jgi:hypothetical protein